MSYQQQYGADPGDFTQQPYGQQQQYGQAQYPQQPYGGQQQPHGPQQPQYGQPGGFMPQPSAPHMPQPVGGIENCALKDCGRRRPQIINDAASPATGVRLQPLTPLHALSNVQGFSPFPAGGDAFMTGFATDMLQQSGASYLQRGQAFMQQRMGFMSTDIMHYFFNLNTEYGAVHAAWSV